MQWNKAFKSFEGSLMIKKESNIKDFEYFESTIYIIECESYLV